MKVAKNRVDFSFEHHPPKARLAPMKRNGLDNKLPATKTIECQIRLPKRSFAVSDIPGLQVVRGGGEASSLTTWAVIRKTHVSVFTVGKGLWKDQSLGAWIDGGQRGLPRGCAMDNLCDMTLYGLSDSPEAQRCDR